MNVQFCVDECNPVDCGDDIKSYGRKKRDAEVTLSPRTTQVRRSNKYLFYTILILQSKTFNHLMLY